MSVRVIKIPKGKHKYRGVYWRWPKFVPKLMTRKFMFTPSCLYDLKDEDQHDVNKLFGMSFNFFPTVKEIVPHHINSVRFGWRSLLESNKIQIVVYEYLDRTRISTKVVAEVNVNEWYEYTMYWSDNKMYYVVRQPSGFCISYESNYVLRKDVVLGYELDVYFGGNEKAPQDIIIFQKILK